MLEGDYTALIAGLLTILPGGAIAASTWLPTRLRCLGGAVALLGCGKFFRLRGLFDVYVEPVLARIFHSHNLPVAFAVVSGLISFALVVGALLTTRRSRWGLAIFTIAACAIFVALGHAAYGDSFRPLLSADGLDTTDQALVWGSAMFFQGLTSTIVLVLALRAGNSPVDSGAGRATRLALIVMGIAGLAYFLSKIAFLILMTFDHAGTLAQSLLATSFVSLTLSALGLAFAVYIPAALALHSRFRRFQLLRQSAIRASKRRLWRLSRTPEATHRAIIENADRLILRGEPRTAT